MFRCHSLSSATRAFGLMSAVNVQPAGKVIKPIRNRDAWPRGRSLASGPSKWDFLHPGGTAMSDKKKSVRSTNATLGFPRRCKPRRLRYLANLLCPEEAHHRSRRKDRQACQESCELTRDRRSCQVRWLGELRGWH